MSDIKLFRTDNGIVEELKGTSVQLEKSLQMLIEQNLETFLGIRFLASEHLTGKVHSGRIDTLGIDENGCPVIIEYKRALNENVINQGLFYLDWLMDHKADFKLLVMDIFGKEQSDNIEWNSPRLLCIAGDFTNYDEHAVKQIPRNIELIRYRRYSDGFLLLELVNSTMSPLLGGSIPHAGIKGAPQTLAADPKSPNGEGHLAILDGASQEIRDLFESLRAFLSALGDDVQMKPVRKYIAFKRIRNFAAVAIRPQKNRIQIWTGANTAQVAKNAGFLGREKDGGVRIMLQNQDDLMRAQPVLAAAYDA